jgi:hypothetical protein
MTLALWVDFWNVSDWTGVRITKNVHSFGLGMQHGMGLRLPAGGRYLP